MKFSNKILGIIFAALLVTIFLKRTISKPEVSSIREELVAIDTSLVTKLIIYNGSESKLIINKNNDSWTVSNSDKTVNATESSVHGLLSNIVSIKPQQLIAKSKEKWSNYEVDDKTGKKVEVYAQDRLVDAFYAGRFNFNQQSRSAKTYFRKDNEDDVYSVDGFLSMTFDKKLDDFRNKKLFDGLQKESVKNISVSSKDNIKSINFSNHQWVDQSGAILDSTKISNYISQLVSTYGSHIDDSYLTSDTNIEAVIQLGDLNNNSIAELKVYKDTMPNRPFVFQSSLNENLFFRSDSLGLYQSIIGKMEDLF